jgi:hypothetical protein
VKILQPADCAKEKNPPYNVVFPSQFARLLIEYQEHPEAKSLAPDGTPCEARPARDWDKIEKESIHSVLGFVEQLLSRHFS